jgi:glucan-binding YG repeat protein
MTNGFATFKDSDAKDVKVYVRKDGTVRTDAGWLFVDNDNNRVRKGGANTTNAGEMTNAGDKYIVYESGKIRRKTGVYKLKSGVRYYVLYTSGKLAKYKSIKNKKTGRIYHVASDCHVIIGRHQWKNKKYYFSNEYGYLSTIKRIEKNKTGSYFVKKGGLIAVNTKVSYKGKSYIAGKYGYFKTGLFKWNKRYYYASKTGVLRVKKGKFAYEGYIYYVGSGGVIHSNGLFTESGKKYLANEKGHLQKGLIKWKGKIYYADDNYVIRTKEQILKYNNKFYYIQSGGAIASNRFVTYNGKHYYAKSDGSFYTTKFTYAGVTIKPSKTGVISDSDYKKIFPNG